ncbi:MAG: PqqD family protein [Candidatus Omnitrophica bacterium]|nr:PqqD family protein [Candidatus Omnitrophota bacterium]
MIHLEDRFTKDPDIVHRKVDGEWILVPILPRKEKKGRFYFMEGVEGRIWELVDGRLNCQAIIEEMVSEFRVKKKRAGKEILLFLEELQKEGLIRRTS